MNIFSRILTQAALEHNSEAAFLSFYWEIGDFVLEIVDNAARTRYDDIVS